MVRSNTSSIMAFVVDTNTLIKVLAWHCFLCFLITLSIRVGDTGRVNVSLVYFLDLRVICNLSLLMSLLILYRSYHDG